MMNLFNNTFIGKIQCFTYQSSNRLTDIFRDNTPEIFDDAENTSFRIIDHFSQIST